MPQPGKRSAREIICHPVDSELVRGMGLRQFIVGDRPTLQAFDEKLLVANLDYHKRKDSHAGRWRCWTC